MAGDQVAELDETLALPSEQAAEIALRTQQVIMEETGVVNVADPLGGSWYVEALTDKIEAEAEAIGFAGVLSDHAAMVFVRARGAGMAAASAVAPTAMSAV
ncbi:methylmalonyl-CoA mutase family protein, partial [Roseibium denhamense]|uniref:methylmalonyl-CoA mutase family protein n=1 Tax=Roseibium denhamense TaxID=76305 RepID=UPI0031D36B88